MNLSCDAFPGTPLSCGVTVSCTCVANDITGGGLNTLLIGSAIMNASCDSSDPDLPLVPHVNFGSSSVSCNNGAITIQGVQVNGNAFTSRISVTPQLSWNGTTIGCKTSSPNSNSETEELLVGGTYIQN